MPALPVPKLFLAALVVCCASACADPEKERIRATTKPSYDQQTGKLIELTSDHNKNGRIDTWVEMNGALPVLSKTDVNEDGTLDRWEYYSANVLARGEDDTNGDGVVDQWSTYESGVLKTTAFDDDRDGKADRRWTYKGPNPVLVETEPDAAGNFTKRKAVAQ